MASHIGRRKFLATLGGVVAWPLAARGQQPERMRRVGVLMITAEDDTESKARIGAFRQGLKELGWSDGRNVRIDIRWGAADAERMRKHSAELVALAPDVILAAGGTPTVSALQQMTRTVPIVFVGVADPVGGGFVASLASPGGNTTGFTVYEYAISGKWLELLKEVAPHIQRAILRDSATIAGGGQFGAIQSVAPSLGVEVSPVNVHDVDEIERAVTAFARFPNSGIIVTGSPLTTFHRDLIVTLAARQRLPAVYPYRFFVTGGGLISYGPDPTDQYWRAAGYVDRVLKGEKPADLPVQAPVKYELAINLRTARALGIEVPLPLLARADEVIE